MPSSYLGIWLLAQSFLQSRVEHVQVLGLALMGVAGQFQLTGIDGSHQLSDPFVKM